MGILLKWPWPRIALAAGMLLAAIAPAQAAPVAAGGETRSVIVTPLSLVKTQDLSFGDFASGPTAGTVVVNEATGARTATGGVTLLGGTVSPASFTGAASGLNVVVIRRPTTPITLTRVGGTETMRINNLAIEGGQFRLFFTRQAFDFNIGGTLSVNANQADGTYVGTFAVTVDYY